VNAVTSRPIVLLAHEDEEEAMKKPGLLGKQPPPLV
jgi:hypothetical protein